MKIFARCMMYFLYFLLVMSCSWRKEKVVCHSVKEKMDNTSVEHGDQSNTSSPTLFPKELHKTYVESLFKKLEKGSLNYADDQLVFELLKCLWYDSRCSYHLALFYFKGLIKPRLIFEQDTGKSIVTAMRLLNHSSRLSNADAQYMLGSIYSSFFNPPIYFQYPHEIICSMPESIRNNNLNCEEYQQMNREFIPDFNFNLSFKVPKTNTSVNGDFVSILKSVSLVDAFRFESTMKVLEYSLTPNAYELETKILNNLEDFILKSKVPDDVNKLKVKEFNNIQKHISKKRFPLYRHEPSTLLYLYSAAQAGHIGANLALGFRHLKGIGVVKKCKIAASYYLRVASDVTEFVSDGVLLNQNNIRLSLSGLNTLHIEKNNYYTMASKLKSQYLDLQLHMAQTGDPRTQTLIGNMYLYGIDDFEQNFTLALRYFRLAAKKDYKDAISYIGYMYTLGLGVKKNYDIAYKLFRYASYSSTDVLANNGLGYIYFKGTPTIRKSLTQSIYHFKISASRGFADAQYNLGVLYFIGHGVQQSKSQASKWFSKALEQNHPSAAYLLGVMHLNGVNANKDCTIGVMLLQKVAEKHEWVTRKLRKAYISLKHGNYNEAAFNYWLLAEAGHEVSQTNLGVLLDGGGLKKTVILDPNKGKLYNQLYISLTNLPFIKSNFTRPVSLFSLTRIPNTGMNIALAQKYWEWSSLQRSTFSLLRLGDYAYHGYGTLYNNDIRIHSPSFRWIIGVHTNDQDKLANQPQDKSIDTWPHSQGFINSIQILRNEPNYNHAFYYYKTILSYESDQNWSSSFFSQANFSLGLMYLQGKGVSKDLIIAQTYFKNVLDIDSKVTKMPAKLMLYYLHVDSIIYKLKKNISMQIFFQNWVSICLVLNLFSICVLFLVKNILRYFS